VAPLSLAPLLTFQEPLATEGPTEGRLLQVDASRAINITVTTNFFRNEFVGDSN
jgi:hypothetical protein